MFNLQDEIKDLMRKRHKAVDSIKDKKFLASATLVEATKKYKVVVNSKESFSVVADEIVYCKADGVMLFLRDGFPVGATKEWARWFEVDRCSTSK
jgi:hypothetical protein